MGGEGGGFGGLGGGGSFEPPVVPPAPEDGLPEDLIGPVLPPEPPAGPGEIGPNAGEGEFACPETEGNPADATQKLKLNKSLASEQQMSEPGIRIAGKGTNTVFRDAPRIADEYGGNASDWVKMVSRSCEAADGAVIQTHWVDSIVTRERMEIRTVSLNLR